MIKKRFYGVRIVGLFFLLLLMAGCEKPRTPVAKTPTPAETVEPWVDIDGPVKEPPAEMSLDVQGDVVTVKLPWKDAEVVRGYVPVRGVPRASKKRLTVVDGTAEDDRIPSNVELFYYAKEPGGLWAEASIKIPNQALPALNNPSLEVDKINFTLEIRDGGQVKKRYPIGLGQNPLNRKYCQDMASTPEGWYEIYNLQPDATYHKALDVDYPRAIDYVRHRLAIEQGTIEPERPIGGEIQIHGWGMGFNWTAGCMSLRDSDMDEIFNDPAIRAGMPLFIAGSQFRPSDKSWLKSPSSDAVKTVQKQLKAAGFYQGAIDGQLGDGTAFALGKYQQLNGLPDSCQLDGKTREHFQI